VFFLVGGELGAFVVLVGDLVVGLRVVGAGVPLPLTHLALPFFTCHKHPVSTFVFTHFLDVPTAKGRPQQAVFVLKSGQRGPRLGDLVGANVGVLVGDLVGLFVGKVVGALLGLAVRLLIHLLFNHSQRSAPMETHPTFAVNVPHPRNVGALVGRLVGLTGLFVGRLVAGVGGTGALVGFLVTGDFVVGVLVGFLVVGVVGAGGSVTSRVIQPFWTPGHSQSARALHANRSVTSSQGFGGVPAKT
jgi:hypothetical protein